MNEIIYTKKLVPVMHIADYFNIPFKMFMRSERAFQIYLIRLYYKENG